MYIQFAMVPCFRMVPDNGSFRHFLTELLNIWYNKFRKTEITYITLDLGTYRHMFSKMLLSKWWRVLRLSLLVATAFFKDLLSKTNLHSNTSVFQFVCKFRTQMYVNCYIFEWEVFVLLIRFSLLLVLVLWHKTDWNTVLIQQ